MSRTAASRPLPKFKEAGSEPNPHAEGRKAQFGNVLGVRAPDFQTTKEEYATYEDTRNDFLMNNPHAVQAALGAGGIIWRLAVGTLQLDLVVEGPRGQPDQQATVSLDENSYVADALTAHEEDLICGVYRVLARKLDSIRIH